MGLASQAFRLLKTRWDDPQYLAQEMYLILLTDQDPTTGPVAVQQASGDDPFFLPAGLADDPLPDLNLPDLDLPPFPDNPYQQEQQPDDTPIPLEGGTRYQRKRTEKVTKHTRLVVPGKVGRGSQGRYNVTLYPNSTQDGGTGGTPQTEAVAITEFPEDSQPTVDGVKQLDGDTKVPAGTWALVFRHTEWEIKTTKLVETGVGIQGEKIISTTTEIRVVARHHEMQASGSSGGGVPVMIVSGGPGTSYQADAYPQGLAKESERVTVTVLQLDASETIPAGQWYIAAKIGTDYFIQPPIWIADQP